MPGFNDQHTHGGYGSSYVKFSDNISNDLTVLKNKLAKEGVCGVFVTTVTLTGKCLLVLPLSHGSLLLLWNT